MIRRAEDSDRNQQQLPEITQHRFLVQTSGWFKCLLAPRMNITNNGQSCANKPISKTIHHLSSFDVSVEAAEEFDV